MSLVIVFPEATRSGGLIARELARAEPVHAILMQDGQLTSWLKDQLGPGNVSVRASDEFAPTTSFERKVKAAAKSLLGLSFDTIYLMSLVASPFAFAAKTMERRAVLHGGETLDEIRELLGDGRTRVEMLRLVDALILADAELTKDFRAAFGNLPRIVEIVGPIVDVDAIRAAAAKEAPRATNAAGRAVRKAPDRLVVGMSGQASRDAGADLFLEVAKANPEHDFVWIGAWEPEEAPENIAYEAYVAAPPSNLYLTGATENPYRRVADLDLFFLSARRGADMLAAAEAICLGKPVLCFSQGAGGADRLGRATILCHGRPNEPDASRIIRKLGRAARDKAFMRLLEGAADSFDVRRQGAILRELFAKARFADERG